MRVWLLTVGEPLPTDNGRARLWRTGLLARRLVERGHDVVWWSSAFDHVHRRLSPTVDTPIAVGQRLTVWHLAGTPYRRNISVRRLMNHYQVARRFSQLAAGQPRPDVILSSLPTLELSCAAVDYGAANGVPVALDVRDLWPDVLFDMLPMGTRGVARHAMHWMTRQLRRSATGATAILGVTDEFVQWGVEAARRPPTSRDRAFPMGYSSRMPNQEDLNAARGFWSARGLDEAPQRPIVCFFGTFGWMFDFKTVMFAAERLQEVAPELRLVLCGTGGKIEEIRRRASGLSNVLLPGYVGPSEIWDLMRRSIAGLAPYRPLRNFDDNLPNKPIEYLSAGLPIISCELRLLKRLIEQYECGLTYAHGDVDGLVNAVLRLLHNPTLRASMSRRAGQLYTDRFTAEVVYDSMASHLEALVEVEGSPRAPLRQV